MFLRIVPLKMPCHPGGVGKFPIMWRPGLFYFYEGIPTKTFICDCYWVGVVPEETEHHLEKCLCRGYVSFPGGYAGEKSLDH